MTFWPSPTMTSIGRETLATYDFGPPTFGAGGDLVLLHGMADVARSLEPLVHVLAERFRVVAFDARGHGRSSHPGAYSGLHFVADLRSVVEVLGLQRPVLVGHSLGGHTVANYAGLYPDEVRAVVLLEGLGPPSPTTPDPLGQARASVEILRSASRHRPQPDVAAAAARLLATHPRLDPAWALVLAEEGTIDGPDGGLIWRHDERTWHWVSSIDNDALAERWAAITAPVLAVSGAEAWDGWWARPGGPSTGRRRMTAAEAGHMLHFDQPERVTKVIDEFLRRRVDLG